MFSGDYTCRELAGLHTTMCCLMKTTSLLMAYKPSLTICATRNVLAFLFDELVCSALYNMVVLIVFLKFLSRYARCTRSVSIGQTVISLFCFRVLFFNFYFYMKFNYFHQNGNTLHVKSCSAPCILRPFGSF